MGANLTNQRVEDFFEYAAIHIAFKTTERDTRCLRVDKFFVFYLRDIQADQRVPK